MHPSPSLGKPLTGGVGRDRGCPRNPRVPIKCWWPVWGQSHSGMAEPGPEPGRAWRLLALCGAAVFLAAAAAGGALVAWNLAASTARGTRCPESEQVNATVWPPDSTPEIEELRRRLVEAEQRQESLAGWLQRAEGDRRELEVALKACKDRQVGAGESQNVLQRDLLAYL